MRGDPGHLIEKTPTRGVRGQRPRASCYYISLEIEMKTTTCVVGELTLVHGTTGVLAADRESIPAGALVRNMVEDSREESDFTGEVIVRVSFDASTDGGESWYTYRALVYENDYLASLFEVDFAR